MPVTSHPQASTTAGSPVRIVLDTNVVLDWLWFDDPRVARLAAALQSGRLHWLATAPMRRELECVLARLPQDPAAHSKEHALTSFDAQSTLVGVSPVFERLRCSDGDDQKFIDLAVASGAIWLISRDRAVLRLARRASAFGLAIVTPERWA
jgi:putative PIN family toxin of toxin-antitoxin system